ncbi:MAG: SUMF1/EgtB/PvdO family nonheme iron enzyme [Chloroflexi bacterium]|nr:SUMF1/EgtB/PvdO family nonheme iron enzyme [Chloroflexota bacterium]
MAFPDDVAERLLVACHRRCCLCEKFVGNKMEIHHIVPKSEGGQDTEENGIPLCLECHAEVGAYNPRHPKGRKFTPSELRKHKEQWFAKCAAPSWRTAPSQSEANVLEIRIRVFISYSRQDSAFAERLEAALQERGIATWRDATSIHGGDNWYKSIARGLADSDAVLCVVTPNSDRSEWVLREQLRVLQDGIPLFPLLPATHRLPWHMQELQPILMDDFHFEAGLSELVAALKRCKKRRPNVPTGTMRPGMPGVSAPEHDDSAIQGYLKWVLSEAGGDLRHARYVDLAAEPQRAPSPLAAGLEDEFVFTCIELERLPYEDLDKRGDDVPDARQAIRDLRRTVLLGEPGAGKTWTLLKIAIDLARAAQADSAALLPLFIPLREFKGTMPFADFVRGKANNLQSGFDNLQDRFVLLCDALNEMPRTGPDKRDLVAEVRDYLGDKADWVVSCRVRDYADDLSSLSQVGILRLRPLDPPRIWEFISRRFAGWGQPPRGAALWAAMGGSDKLLAFWNKMRKHGESDHFWDAQRGVPSYTGADEDSAWGAMHRDHRRLLSLCRSPYMANMLCALYRDARKLPENRAGLFADFVTNLLNAERRRLEKTGLAWIGDAPIRDGLGPVAWALGALTEMARADAEALLRKHVPGHDAAEVLSAAVGAGIIYYGDTVRFTHQLLQQYFAAAVLGAELDGGGDPASIWKGENWWASTGREETAVLLAGNRKDPQGVARWLAPAQPELALQLLAQPDFGLNPATPDAGLRTALIAGARDKAGGPHPVGRAAAYRVLGRLDADPRPGTGVITVKIDGRDVELPHIEWCDAPAPKGDTFIMGADDQSNNPRREVKLDYSFKIAKYLITYQQFQAFVDSGEYDNPAWWRGFPSGYRPQAMAEQNNRYGNHPRDNVSWYQAVAFTRWLDHQYSQAGLMPLLPGAAWGKGQGVSAEIRLPTEQEWEYAARGTDGRTYPYPGDFDAAKGNTRETGIGQTSAVGLFPDGAAACDALDMAGNVWEWCLNDYRKPEVLDGYGTGEWKVLRGGSFFSNEDLVRCACRLRLYPDFRYDYFGFRVAASPLPSGL